MIEAQHLGAPATVIEAAVAARNLSSQKTHRVADEALFGPAPRKLGGALGTRDGAMTVLEEAMEP